MIKRTLQIGLTLSTVATVFFGAPAEFRLIEIDPGHSHLSSFHVVMLPGVSDAVHIYSPLTAELSAHLAAISRFNARPDNPTHWSVQLFAGPNYLLDFRKEAPGAIVALSGRNSANIGYIETALAAGDHVFADKPLLVDPEMFPRFEAAIKLARTKHLVVSDWMTLRKEPPYRLVRDLVGQEAVFGKPVPGSVENPSVRLENLHALLKYSNGVPQKRPAVFLDVRQQGEGMADVGTHIADLAQWTLFPDQKISHSSDIRMLRATHTALAMTLEQFTRLTGEAAWPLYLKDKIVNGKLMDYTNGSCVYSLKGVHVSLKVGWQYEARPGEGDSYFESYQGSRALVELRAGPNEKFTPEIFVTPTEASEKWEAGFQAALGPLTYERVGKSFHVLLPKDGRNGDSLQKTFLEFLGYARDWSSFPEYENSNLLAKYYVTTQAVKLANAR